MDMATRYALALTEKVRKAASISRSDPPLSPFFLTIATVIWTPLFPQAGIEN